MINLHYRKYGAGSPLIILHGLFGSSDNWHTLARRWGESFTVYTLDQRNHGSSPHESAMDYQEMVNDLDHFLHQQRLESVNILGHSMGGKVALLYASQHPEKVTALAILDIGIHQTTGQHEHLLDALRKVDPAEFSDRRSIDEELKKFIQQGPIRQFLLKNIIRRVDSSFGWKFNHETLLDHYTDLTAALDLDGSFSGPVLFLRGENSNYIDKFLDPETRQYFPYAQLSNIPEAGHWLHAEQPDLIFDQIRTFLKGT